MRFGFVVPNIISPISGGEAVKESARVAEVAGFDSLWVSDHILVPKEKERYARGTEALMTLAYLAGVTRQVSFGLSVLILPMRNPIIAAKQIATLAHLAERDVIVGVGVGWSKDEYSFLNADFHRRGKLVDEYIEIMRKLWTDPDAAHSGSYTFADANFAPQLDKALPVWIGGTSDAAIRRAAEIGDGFQPTLDSGLDEFAEQVRKLRAWSGGRPITVSISMTLDMNDGAQAVIDTLAQFRDAGLEYPVLRFEHETLSDLTRQIELFGRDVIPALRHA